MSADLLDDWLIKVTRVTQEVLGDIVCVLQSIKDRLSERELRSFPEFGSLILAVEMDVLDPTVVVKCGGWGDVLLEYNLLIRISDGFADDGRDMLTM